jgi:tetratricopeptide (TPR) repeat protein
LPLGIKLKKLSNQQYVGAYNTGLIYLGMGRYDEAFNYFNLGIEQQHNGLLFFLKQNFRVLPGLKKDPRMEEIIAKLELPD